MDMSLIEHMDKFSVKYRKGVSQFLNFAKYDVNH